MLPPPSTVVPAEPLGDDPFLIFPDGRDQCSIGDTILFDLQNDVDFPAGYWGPTDKLDVRFEARCRQHGVPYLAEWRWQRK